MKHLIIASLIAIGVAACSGETQMMSSSEASDTALSVTVSEGYVMAPLRGRDVAAGYFTASNKGDADAIISASSPFADTIELHTHLMEDGVMKMREVEQVELPADGSVEFKPGGYHLMIFGFKRAEDQTAIPVTLTLQSGSKMDVSLPIRDREG